MCDEMKRAGESDPSSAGIEWRVEMERLKLSVCRRPLRALAIFGGIGFVVGGGLRSRLGLGLGLFVGRNLAGTAVVNAIETLAEQNGRQYRPNQRRVRRSAGEPSADRG